MKNTRDENRTIVILTILIVVFFVVPWLVQLGFWLFH